jgi:hypothetical protein
MSSLTSAARSHAVTILDAADVWLRCDHCGSVWSPNLRTGGRLPRRWWACPRRCNTPTNGLEG